MASYTETTNYKLKKGSGGTAQSIEQQRVYDNENADTIDSTMKTISNAANAAQSDADTAQATANTAQGEVDALEIVVATKESIVNVSANRSSTLKSISTTGTPSTDYLAHLYTVTGYAQSQSMPNNADGKALWSVNGLTAENLIGSNGDFSNGTTGWTGVLSALTVANGNMIVAGLTGSGGNSYPAISKAKSFLAGRKYYLKCKIKITNEVCTKVDFQLGAVLVKRITSPTINTIYTFSEIHQLVANQAVIALYHQYVDADTAKGKVMEVIGGENGVRAYDITGTPYENWTADQLSALFENYQDGIRSTLAGLRLFGRGKNLLLTNIDDWEQGNILNTDGTLSPSNSYVRTKNYTKLKQSTNYAISTSSLVFFGAILYDKNFNFSRYVSVSTFTTTENEFYVKIRMALNAGGSLNNSVLPLAKPQLELGSVATTYEPYAAATAYTPQGTLRSVPSASDEVYSDADGRTWKIKRIDDDGTTVLATPITTELETIGELKAYPNGSILAEPCYSGYATGASTIIGTASLPIKAINKVESISLDSNGNAVRTDVTSSCSVDTTTLTITGYDASKVYFYDLDIDTKYTTSGLKTYQVECPTAVVTHDFLAGSTAWTLTANENKANYLKGINAGGAANVIFQPINGMIKVYQNASGQTQTLKTASSTGITVADGKTAIFSYMGTDFIKLSEV